MIKELEALQKLRDLFENLTRITALRNEVKKLLIYSYEASNGYFSQIEKALKRNEPMKVEIGTSKHFKFPICPNCKTELNEYYKYANKFCKKCGQRLDWSDNETGF